MKAGHTIAEILLRFRVLFYIGSGKLRFYIIVCVLKFSTCSRGENHSFSAAWKIPVDRKTFRVLSVSGGPISGFNPTTAGWGHGKPYIILKAYSRWGTGSSSSRASWWQHLPEDAWDVQQQGVITRAVEGDLTLPLVLRPKLIMLVMWRCRTSTTNLHKGTFQADDGLCHVGRRRNGKKFHPWTKIQMMVITAVSLYNCCISREQFVVSFPPVSSKAVGVSDDQDK